MARRSRKTVNLCVTVIQIVENLRRSWFLQKDVAGDYLFEYHEDDPIWDFHVGLMAGSARIFYRARQKAQFKKEVAAYLAAKELASRQITGYLVYVPLKHPDYRYQDYSSDYSRTVNTHPMYSEPEVTQEYWKDHDQWYGP
jgi:hypothetical protein